MQKIQIIAIDVLQEFLNKLQEKIDRKNLSNRVVTKRSLMENLNFQEKSFDVIWSEGAIYNIEFEKYNYDENVKEFIKMGLDEI
ncbi:MAG TPA: class I SAM-dependent methyltransferase [Schnuerera sp.]|nr:class I SAM-dependent methyltransferase [Schnuerera sp.]